MGLLTHSVLSYIQGPAFGSCFDVRITKDNPSCKTQTPSTWIFILVVRPAAACPPPGLAFC